MRIGWLIETLGMFGSVREMVEISNALIRRGHDVTLYTKKGEPCTWLPSLSKTAPASQVDNDSLDVLIGLTDWSAALQAIIDASTVPVKIMCVVGFTPSDDLADLLTGRTETDDKETLMFRNAVSGRYGVMTDSSWQVAWLRSHVGIEALPPFGGVNPDMFRPVNIKRTRPPYRVIASGDPRGRKGSDTVKAAVARLGDDVTFDTYWKKGIPQDKLCEFLSGADVFLDAQRRAGWSNPVAEAMACGGAAVVCTDIPANSDFAIDGETALIVPVDDDAAMADATKRLLGDEELRMRLVRAAYKRIQHFAYEAMAPALEAALEKLI